MASHKIKYPKEVVLEKLNTRISKGKVIAEKYLEMIGENPIADNDRFYVDKIKTDYDQWYEVTNSLLLDIFESSTYAYNFRQTKSSKKEYVNSNWQPNIKFYLTYELLPKLNYLKVLKENIDDYDEVEKELKDNSANSTMENDKLLNADEKLSEDFEIDKIPISYFLKRISLPQLISIIGFIIILISGSFYFGYNVKSWQIDREKVELNQENEAASNKIKVLQKEVDSLKQIDSLKFILMNRP
jgi:hypothetical protein